MILGGLCFIIWEQKGESEWSKPVADGFFVPGRNRKSLLKVGELLGGLGQRIGLTLYYGNKRLIVSKYNYFSIHKAIYHILEKQARRFIIFL